VQKVKQETKMIVYPAKGQSAGQQAIDEQECYVWSQQQTGIDPMAAGPNADSAAAASADKMDSATTGRDGWRGSRCRRRRDNRRITGRRGGAAVGAVAGAVSRRAKKGPRSRRRNRARPRLKHLSRANGHLQKGWRACLNGRAYTVQ
jgi:hypothetical protein